VSVAACAPEASSAPSRAQDAEAARHTAPMRWS
jgi:hypothetical protein